MKVLKGFLTFIISFTLVILIIGFTVSVTLKEVQTKIVSEVVKQAAINESNDEVSISASVIDDLLSYNGANEIINSVVSDYSNYLENNNQKVSDETLDLIINFCIDNKENLEKLSGSEIDINELRSQEARNNLRNALDESFEEIKVDSNSPVKSIVSTYAKVTSSEFKKLVLITIIVLVILLALLSFSLYKWIKPLGTVLTTSGIFVLGIYLLLFLLLSFINQNYQIDIDTKSLLLYGIIETVSGIVLLVIYSVINKKTNNTKVELNEIENS